MYQQTLADGTARHGFITQINAFRLTVITKLVTKDRELAVMAAGWTMMRTVFLSRRQQKSALHSLLVVTTTDGGGDDNGDD